MDCKAKTGKNENRGMHRTENTNTRAKQWRLIVLIVLAVIVCAIVWLSMRELSLIDDAKDIVDRIIAYSIEKAEAEMELESGSQLVSFYQKKIDNAEKILDSLYKVLDNICAELSEHGKAKVQDYINEASQIAVDNYNLLN